MGLTYFGLLPGRDDDSIGFGLAYGEMTGDAKAANFFFGGDDLRIELRLNPSETMLTWYYQMKIRDGIYAQPNLTYIPDPGQHPGIPGPSSSRCERSYCSDRLAQAPSGYFSRKPVNHSIRRSRITTSETISPALSINNRSGSLGVAAGLAWLIEQTDAHKVPLKFLLRELLTRLARLGVLIGTGHTRVDRMSQPNEGIANYGVLAGITA